MCFSQSICRLHILWKTSWISGADTHLWPGGYCFLRFTASSVYACLWGCVPVCLAGLPRHLAAPLSHRGLQEVADQGPQPGSVADDGELQQKKEVCVDAYMCASEYVRPCLCAFVNPLRRWLIPVAIKPIISVIPPKLPRVWCSPLLPLLPPMSPLSSWEDDNVPLVLSGARKKGSGGRGRRESQQRGQTDRQGRAEARNR